MSAVEQAIGRKQRHPPHRIGHRLARREQTRRPGCRRCRTAPAGRCPAPRAPHRSGSRNRPSWWASPKRPRAAHRTGSSGPRHRCCRSRPIIPLRVGTTSSGRKALPETLFSTAGISTPQPHRQLARHHHRRDGQHRGRTAHVLLHVEHAGRRLEIEAAGVEAHALAHQRDLGIALLAPDEIDQARRPRRRRGRPHAPSDNSASGDRRPRSPSPWPCAPCPAPAPPQPARPAPCPTTAW